MPGIARADQHLLDILIEWEVLTPEQAEVYAGKLLVYRRNHPDVGLADVLERRGLLHPDDLHEALDEVDQRLHREEHPPRRRPAATPRTRQPRRVSRSRPSVTAAHARPPRADKTVPLVFAAVIVTVGILAAVIFLQDSGGETRQETAQAPEVEPQEPETALPEPATPPSEEPTVDHEERQLRAELRSIRALPLQERVAALDDLAIDAAPRFGSQIQVELQRARRELDQRAKLAYPRLEELSNDAGSVEEMAAAAAKLEEFLSDYGQNVMSGRPARERAALVRRLDNECEKLLVAAEAAFQNDDLETAEEHFACVARSGLDEHVRPAERGLRKVQRRGSRGTIAKASGRSEKSGRAEPTPKPEKKTSKEDSVAKKPTKKDAAEGGGTVVDRISFLRPKLIELCPSRKYTLDDRGLFSISYDFEEKRYTDGEDWTPALASGKQSHQSPIRWTLYQEEVVVDGMTGVRISDRGVWRHNVKLLAPIHVDVVYYPMNQFNKQNQFHVAWVTEAGKGVGANMGLVSGTFSGGVFGKPSGVLEPISGFSSYQIGLTVTKSGYQGRFRRKTTPLRKLPRKFDSGFVAFVFRNDVAGTIQSVSIRGMLDLDWAEEELR
ncbi:MAG: hypothetical protein AAF581_21105 [Planctomycetota bacterium]